MRRRALPHPVQENIQQVFRLLLDANAEQRVGVVLRVAGGWVRDQLLGVESNDIDIAIETPETLMEQRGRLVTGSDFASAVRIYQEQRHLETRTISVIKTNPEKSKHIETAQMTLLGVPVEFCHLRQDEYSDLSRVPVVRRGTPLEDSMRRDFTVNALFYNLHTSEVEDYTGSGFEDMAQRVLRTPLSARETFLDDPLRLLRGVRFAGQLGYTLHDDVLAAAADAEVLEALRQKVARERVGIELAKMLRGNDPVLCLRYMGRLGLLQHCIFFEAYLSKKKKAEVDHVLPALPVDDGAALSAALMRIAHYACDVYGALLHQPSLPPPESSGDALATMAAEDVRAATGADRLVASMFFLCVGVYGELDAASRAERLTAFSTNGVKLPGSVAEAVTKLLAAHSALASHSAALIEAAVDAKPSIAAGATMVGPIFVGDLRDALFDALVPLARNTPRCALGCVLAACLSALPQCGVGEALVGCVCDVLCAIAADSSGQLLASPTRAPLVKGQEIPAVLGVDRRQTGAYLALQARFLLHHPNASREDVMNHLMAAAAAQGAQPPGGTA